MRKRYNVKILKQEQLVRYSDGTYSKRVDMPWYSFVITLYADGEDHIREMLSENIEWIEEF
tara:strand:- start:465 stop:647 length:183 start_codon:yes stop_codon:yes gene_type:complete